MLPEIIDCFFYVMTPILKEDGLLHDQVCMRRRVAVFLPLSVFTCVWRLIVQEGSFTEGYDFGGIGGVVATPHDDPGNLTNVPDSLYAFYDFDEADGPEPDKLLNFAYDRVGERDGAFQGTATRTSIRFCLLLE